MTTPRRPFTAVAPLVGLAFVTGCPFGPSDFGPVVLPYCLENERVMGGQCEPCPDNATSPAGALRDGEDTECVCADGFEPDGNNGCAFTIVRCGPNERVEITTVGTVPTTVTSTACVACAPGTIRQAGDPITGPDVRETECEIEFCDADERVQDNTCVPCLSLQTNRALDVAIGPDTFCDCIPGATRQGDTPGSPCVADTCETDERVEDNQCVPCDPGFVNPAFGSPPPAQPEQSTDEDTTCTRDDCFFVVDLLCRVHEEAELGAIDPQASDGFGFAVDMTNDFIAIGAPNEADDSGVRNGVVRVYRRQAEAWALDQLLNAPSGGAPAFGAAVALSDGLLVVGAPQDSDGRGAVYVYVRTATSAGGDPWGPPADRLVPGDDLDRFDRFGASVAIDERTIAVGTPGRDDGVVYVFAPSPIPNRWGEPETLVAPAAGEFGSGVAVRADTLIVGAPAVDADRGAAYIYRNGPTGWSILRTLTASVTEAGARFGAAVDLDAEFIVVGAPDQSGVLADGVQADRVGTVSIFDTPTGDFVEGLRATTVDAGDRFGAAVAVETALVAVGAPLEDGTFEAFNVEDTNNPVRDSGAVYVFENAEGQWRKRVFLKLRNPSVDDEFGTSFGLTPTGIAVGAPGQLPGGTTVVRRLRP